LTQSHSRWYTVCSKNQIPSPSYPLSPFQPPCSGNRSDTGAMAGVDPYFRNQGMKQSKLAETPEVQPISVGRLIDRMEAAGWVKRCPDPSDRQAVNLYLTDKAEPILTKRQGHGSALRAKALSGVPEKEQEYAARSFCGAQKPDWRRRINK